MKRAVFFYFYLVGTIWILGSTWTMSATLRTKQTQVRNWRKQTLKYVLVTAKNMINLVVWIWQFQGLEKNEYRESLRNKNKHYLFLVLPKTKLPISKCTNIFFSSRLNIFFTKRVFVLEKYRLCLPSQCHKNVNLFVLMVLIPSPTNAIVPLFIYRWQLFCYGKWTVFLIQTIVLVVTSRGDSSSLVGIVGLVLPDILSPWKWFQLELLSDPFLMEKKVDKKWYEWYEN